MIIGGALGAAYSFVKNVGETVSEGFATTVGAAAGVAHTIGDQVVADATAAFDAATSVGSMVVDGVASGVKMTTEAVVSGAQAVGEFAVDTAGKVVDGTKQFIDAEVQSFNEAAGVVDNGMLHDEEGIVDHFSKGHDAVFDTFKSENMPSLFKQGMEVVSNGASNASHAMKRAAGLEPVGKIGDSIMGLVESGAKAASEVAKKATAVVERETEPASGFLKVSKLDGDQMEA